MFSFILLQNWKILIGITSFGMVSSSVVVSCCKEWKYLNLNLQISMPAILRTIPVNMLDVHNKTKISKQRD